MENETKEKRNKQKTPENHHFLMYNKLNNMDLQPLHNFTIFC